MSIRDEMHTLVQDIAGCHESRTRGITALRDEVKGQKQATKVQIQEVAKDRQTMAQQQHADLARTCADIRQADQQRRIEVRDQISGIAATREKMAQRQRDDLAKGRASLAKECAELIKAERQRKAEVNAWMSEISSTRAEARKEWQSLTATVPAKRGKARPAARDISEEEAVAKVGIAEITPELADTRNKVFEYLANRPDGTRLVELEQHFGLARIQTSKILKSLMDENKVEKRELLYFAV